MTTSTVSRPSSTSTSNRARTQSAHSSLNRIAPKVAPKSDGPRSEAAKNDKSKNEHTRLSQEADGLLRNSDTKSPVAKSDAKDSKGAEKADEAKELSLKDRIEQLEKELAELRKALLEKKEADQAEQAEKAADKGAGKSSGASGPASDKGPTVMNPDAPAGFLWKPQSDSDGNLAILLPPAMTGKVSGVDVLSPDGQVLASGRAAGVGNGDREHFRFNRQGSAFPPNSRVRIRLKSGATQEITIPQTGIRNEGSGKNK